MKLFNEYVIVAKDASVDGNDQTLSIYKIVDNFGFGYRKEEYDAFVRSNPGQPLVFPISYAIVSSWKLERQTPSNIPFKINTKLIDPEGKVLNENSQEAVIAKGNDKVRFNVNVQGMPVTISGKYIYTLEAIDDKGKELATGNTRINIELKPEKNS
jgi:hypothetical protein